MGVVWLVCETTHLTLIFSAYLALNPVSLCPADSNHTIEPEYRQTVHFLIIASQVSGDTNSTGQISAQTLEHTRCYLPCARSCTFLLMHQPQPFSQSNTRVVVFCLDNEPELSI